MTNNDILTINKVGDLFPNNLAKCKQKYKELAKQFHPDANANSSTEIFMKIKSLYEHALQLIEKGEWEKTNFIQIKSKDSHLYELNYFETFRFELGDCYISKSKILYILDSDKKKYYLNYIFMLENIKYRDKQMEDSIKPLLPKIYKHFECFNGKFCIFLDKTSDVYSLNYIDNYFKHKIDARHVAWIISRLSNISCFLSYNDIVLNGFSIETCFISPKYHSILLFGGWWYATKVNQKMIGTTKEIFDIMPISVKSNKLSSYITDLETIKLIGRYLLGDKNSVTLMHNNNLPKPMVEFLISGSSKNPIEEFSKWDTYLDKSFGERKFVEMTIN